MAHTLLLAGKQGLTNIRVAQVNAPELFKVTAAGTVAEVWTFFPTLAQEEAPQAPHRAEGHGRRHSSRAGHRRRLAYRHRHRGLCPARARGDGRLDGWKNLGSVTVSLPLEHVGKGNADMAADMPHADFTESERFEGRVLTNFEKKGLAAGRVIHDFTYQAVTLN